MIRKARNEQKEARIYHDTFEDGIKEIRAKLAKEIFDKPISKIIYS